MTKKSCIANLLEYLEYVTSQLDDGNTVDVICLDFRKAFDEVLHTARLINKASALGTNNVFRLD